MKAEHINPFIISVSKIMKDICMLDLKIGKPFIKDDKYEEDSSLIKLGIIGALKGEVVLNLHYETALAVISKMMMMPVAEIDAIGQSAISELGNMIQKMYSDFDCRNYGYTKFGKMIESFPELQTRKDDSSNGITKIVLVRKKEENEG